MPGELTAKGKVVGLKQTRRALVQGAAAHVYLACDADPRLTDPLRALCGDAYDRVGFVLPAMDKEQFFPTLRRVGVLPRKTFSMGEANEKRYYMECRKIR